jgi:hypothetical protein
MLPQSLRDQFQLMQTGNHCSEHPNGSYTVTYTICESDTANGAVSPSNSVHSYGNVSGSNHCTDDTLGTPATISFRYYTSIAGSVLGNDTLNGVAVTTNNECYPITTGAILVDADGNVTIAANTPTGLHLYHL